MRTMCNNCHTAKQHMGISPR